MSVKQAMLSIGGPYGEIVSWVIRIMVIVYIIRVASGVIIDLI